MTEEVFSSVSTRNYDEEVIGFALTRKFADWRDYLIQFECLLVQLNFNVAKVELETEMEGTYHWYWQRKPYEYRIDEMAKLELTETPYWYFGQGVRSMWGHHIDGYDSFPIPMDFEYPVIFSGDALLAVNRAIPDLNKIAIGEKIPYDMLWEITGLPQSDGQHYILSYLAGRGLIRHNFNKEKGAWIERLDRLVPLNPVMVNNF